MDYKGRIGKLFSFIAILAGIFLCCENVWAIEIGTTDPYDPAVDAKSEVIAKNIKISDYQEQPIMAPGIDVPIGLNVSFKITQTLGNSFSVTLTHMLTNPGIAEDFACEAIDAKYYSGGIYAIKDEPEKVLRYHCMPFARMWDKSKQTIYSFSKPPDKAPLSGEETDVTLSVSITNPNCKSFMPKHPLSHMVYLCREYEHNIVRKLPANIRLNSGAFWYNAIMKTTPHALEAEGYSVCGMIENTPAYFCRKDPAKLSAIKIGGYKERLFTPPGVNRPIGLRISFDIEQKSDEYASTSLFTTNNGTYFPVVECHELKDAKEEMFSWAHRINYMGGNHTYPLNGQKTRVNYLCLPTGFNGDGKFGNPLNVASYKLNILLFLRKTKDVNAGLDATSIFMTAVPPDPKLLDAEFWLDAVNDPAEMKKAGYVRCNSNYDWGDYCYEPSSVKQ